MILASAPCTTSPTRLTKASLNRTTTCGEELGVAALAAEVSVDETEVLLLVARAVVVEVVDAVLEVDVDVCEEVVEVVVYVMVAIDGCGVESPKDQSP